MCAASYDQSSDYTHRTELGRGAGIASAPWTIASAMPGRFEHRDVQGARLARTWQDGSRRVKRQNQIRRPPPAAGGSARAATVIVTVATLPFPDELTARYVKLAAPEILRPVCK